MSEQEIAQLYDEHFDSVYRYVSFRVSRTEDAEDIVSDVFMKVVAKYDTYSPRKGATVRSWIFSIVRNTLIDFYRKQGKPIEQTVDIDDTPIADDTTTVEEIIDHKLSFEQLQEHIEVLPERQKEILLLRYSADMKNTEIAKLLDINQRSVSASLSKATATLRKQINQ